MNRFKKLWECVKDYYLSLSPLKRVVFICVLILIKLGPDLILVPMFYKYIQRKKAEKLDKQADDFENEIEGILDEIDFE